MAHDYIELAMQEEATVTSQTLKCRIEVETLHAQRNQVLIGRNGN